MDGSPADSARHRRFRPENFTEMIPPPDMTLKGNRCAGFSLSGILPQFAAVIF